MPERLWFMCGSHQDFGIDSSATSLSAAALDRFVRPVTYQSLRDERLTLQAATGCSSPSLSRRISSWPPLEDVVPAGTAADAEEVSDRGCHVAAAVNRKFAPRAVS
jgi:hypothetical protein